MSSPAYMRQRTGSSLVHVMACRLFGAKPLPEHTLAYCQLDSWEQISVKFESEFLALLFKEIHLKMSSAKMAAILTRGDELSLRSLVAARWVVTPLASIQGRQCKGHSTYQILHTPIKLGNYPAEPTNNSTKHFLEHINISATQIPIGE